MSVDSQAQPFWSPVDLQGEFLNTLRTGKRRLRVILHCVECARVCPGGLLNGTETTNGVFQCTIEQFILK